MEMPKATINTRDAAEAIFLLYDRFSTGDDLEAWIAEIQEQWPDLAAMVFTAARDE